ncbi:unnamed protein product [Mytilus edulis]|uniref:A-kinase anchor protein 7-like phosphoesterase domain-containing protein n=1 Tax=Mytilus edulis TaxID=6550 RepID=A0A8S3TCV2_MYTED|nr:unnamed protein product [Mytilus edulis]
MVQALDQAVKDFSKDNQADIILDIKDIGTFNNKVVFAKVQENKSLSRVVRLTDIIETNCQTYDVPQSDGNLFNPHITIAKLSRLPFELKGIAVSGYCGPTPVIVSQSTTPNLSVPAPPLAVSSSCSSVSVPAALPTSSVRHQFNQSISSELTSFSNRLGTLENIANKSNSPVISLRPDHDIGSDLEDSDEEERFSVAPGSQEEGFTSDEDDNSVQVSQNVSQPSVPVSISSSVIGQSSTNSSKEPEAEDAPSTLKDLRDSVYTIMRDVNKVPFQSPPRPKKLTSTFEASCGLSVDDTKSHTSFPQSNHMSNSLQIINDGIAANESQFSKVSGFGLASFTEQFRSKDYDIFDSTLGKLVPKCDKVFSSTIASKPADGLRLTQSVWSKTENLLRNASHVLGTAEHFLSAVAPVLKDSSLPPEVKPFLLQVDKALGASQLLIMGSIANCTLSKRSEILDKAKVSDNLKDALIKSPLDEKIFGLPLDEVQKHLNQTPAPVKVNVSLSGNNSKRGSYSSAGGSSYNSQEKRRKITNDGEVETLLTKRAVDEVLYLQYIQVSILVSSLYRRRPENENGHRFVYPQFLHDYSQFQNGDQSFNKSFYSSRSNHSLGIVSSFGLVDFSSKRFERPISVLSSSKSDSVHRCLQPRLGLIWKVFQCQECGLRSLKEHINILEKKAVFLALSHFQSLLKSLVLATNKYHCGSLFAKPRGTHCYELYLLAREILLLCNHLHLQIVVRHVPGKLNVLADALSRTLTPVNTEWELLQSVFQAITLQWGSPHVDLFATSLNYKVQVFMSPVPDPKAYEVNCMSVPCYGMFVYAFPPVQISVTSSSERSQQSKG